MKRLAVVALLVLAACSSDGRALRPPPPGVTAPTPPKDASATTFGTAGTGQGLTLTSPEFSTGEPIPRVHTCDSENIAPPLAWGAVPAETLELAITVTDPDANGYVHWVMAGIDPSVQALAAGAVPDGAVQATNDAGTHGWTGPCPPQGPAHHYVFTLYALTAPSGVVDGADGHAALAAITQLRAPTATLIATYQRAG